MRYRCPLGWASKRAGPSGSKESSCSATTRFLLFERSDSDAPMTCNIQAPTWWKSSSLLFVILLNTTFSFVQVARDRATLSSVLTTVVVDAGRICFLMLALGVGCYSATLRSLMIVPA